MALDISTLAIHGIYDKKNAAVAPVIVTSKAFSQTFGETPAFEYGRGLTPTVASLEQSLNGVEAGSKHCVTFASGLAAEDAFFTNIILQHSKSNNAKNGEKPHIILHNEAYGGTVRLLEQILGKCGLEFSFVDFNKPEQVINAYRPATKHLFVETPTNPKLSIIDLNSVRGLSAKLNVPYAVDNTFATPVLTSPIMEHGANVVINSLSKYISGHNDTIGGAVFCEDSVLYEQLSFLRKAKGAVLSPDSAYRVIQGLKTLSLRVKKQCESAFQIAEKLSTDDRIETVYYPGLKSHPGHNIAAKQMSGYYGGIVTFVLKGDSENVKKFISGVTGQIDGRNIVIYSESLGATETLLSCPYFMSHAGLTKHERSRQGITPNLLRLSLGLEHPDDIYAAIANGLDKIG